MAASEPLLPAKAKWLDQNNEHRLASSFNFWISNDLASYNEDVQCLSAFSTVEGFWRYYSYLKLRQAAAVGCFQTGYQPKWETFPATGARLGLRVRQGSVARRLWELSLLAIVGDPYRLRDDVAGVLMTRKPGLQIHISFWIKDGNDKYKVARVREVIKHVLGIKDDRVLTFQFTHTSARNASASQTQSGDESNENPKKENEGE